MPKHINGSSQIAFDQNGNFNITGSGGAAAAPGAEAGVSLIIGIYPGMDSVDDVKGYGTTIGGSFGDGAMVGVDLVMAGEGNDSHPVGVTVSLGAGASAEGHVGMSYTKGTESYNIYELIDGVVEYLDEQEEKYK